MSIIEFWSCRQQKCNWNPLVGFFEPLKEYGRHCHRYLGKVKFIWVQLDHKKVPKMQFFFWGQNLPRLPFVGLKYMGEDGFTINTQNDRFQWEQGKFWTPPPNRLFMTLHQMGLNDFLLVPDRATTDCGCGASPAAGRIVNGQEVSPMHSRPYQAFLQSCSSQECYQLINPINSGELLQIKLQMIFQSKAFFIINFYTRGDIASCLRQTINNLTYKTKEKHSNLTLTLSDCACIFSDGYFCM